MVTILLGLIIGITIGIVIAGSSIYYYNSKGYSRQAMELEARQKQLDEASELATQEAENTLQEAILEGESKTNTLLLKARDEVHRLKVDMEREWRERKSDLNKEKNRIDQREQVLERRKEGLERELDEIEDRKQEISVVEEELAGQKERLCTELERVASLTMNEAKDRILEEARVSYSHDLAVLFRQMEEQTKENAYEKSREIIVGAIQRYASETVSDATVTVVSLPSDDMKGRIIGREGRNIRTFEHLTGVDAIIDDTPEAVILSCFNPIRREIARMLLNKLVLDGRIHPARIEELHEKCKREIERSIKEYGEQALFETGIIGVHAEIVKLLGRMHFRTSYSQNALRHSIEVSLIAGMMAGELGLDVMATKRAGLLHDIGKAVDFEMEGTHIELGAELARRYNEPEVVINAIESHHGTVEPTSLESCLIAAADAISAARPGARRENLEMYVKRIEKLEEITTSFEGVDTAFAVQAGREIRVIVRPDKIRDEEMNLMAHNICRRIENEMTYPGQVKVSLIRESRHSDFAR